MQYWEWGGRISWIPQPPCFITLRLPPYVSLPTMSYCCLVCRTSTGTGCTDPPGCVYPEDPPDERIYRPGREDDCGYEEERQEISDREWQEYHSAPRSEWDRVREEVWGTGRDSEEPTSPDYPDQYPEHPEPCLAAPAPVVPIASPRPPGAGPPGLQRPPTPPVHGAEPDGPEFPDPFWSWFWE